MILFRVLGGEQRFCSVRSAKYVFVSCLSNARLNGLQFGAECTRLILDFGLLLGDSLVVPDYLFGVVGVRLSLLAILPVFGLYVACRL
jgi:hypothetical protein